MRLDEVGEDRFLERLRRRLPPAGASVHLGIGDDAAALTIPNGERALITADTLVEGTHFTSKTLPPRFIGRKAAAVNVSDIAAMGGQPIALLLCLSVAPDRELAEIDEVFDGLIERARELGVDLVGGNLAATSGPMVLDVTAVGATSGGKLLERRGARPGDAIYVSGRLGASAEGLELLHQGMALSESGALLVPAELRKGPLPLAERCIRAHIDPQPRVELGRFLCDRGAATACLDVSDGMSTDLKRLCEASAVGARLEEAALPVHPGVLTWERLRGRSPLGRALSGGEDYELLFTVKDESTLADWRDREEVPLTRIGTVTEGNEGIRLLLRDGGEQTLGSDGWDHFRRGAATRAARG